jgi:hypothetical protein
VSFRRCPGSASFTQPKIELVRCPYCGGDAEVWSDEPEGRCTACGRTICRTNTQSCIDWCKYARECLGDEKYKNYQNTKSTVRKEALLRAAGDRFGWDERRTEQARRIVQGVESILQEQPEADPNLLLAAAILAFAYRGAAGDGARPDRARIETAQTVLEDLNYPRGFVIQVCEILETSSAGPDDDPNGRALRRAMSLLDSLTA